MLAKVANNAKTKHGWILYGQEKMTMKNEWKNATIIAKNTVVAINMNLILFIIKSHKFSKL